MLGGYPMTATNESVALFPDLIVDHSGGQPEFVMLVRTQAATTR